MSSMDIVWLCIVIIGIICMILSGWWAYRLSQNNKIHSDFRNKDNSNTIWGFTKRNFPIFLTLFFFIVAVVALFTWIQ